MIMVEQSFHNFVQLPNGSNISAMETVLQREDLQQTRICSQSKMLSIYGKSIQKDTLVTLSVVKDGILQVCGIPNVPISNKVITFAKNAEQLFCGFTSKEISKGHRGKEKAAT